MTKYIVIAFVVFVGLAGGYFFYAQGQIKNLAAEGAALRAAVEIQSQTIDLMVQKQDAIQRVLEEFNLSLVELETRANARTKETVRIIERARTAPTAESSAEVSNDINNRFDILESLSSGTKQ